ncbi:murein biosynthesis integral membrane protein MurJ [bacterium]|nr:murein biosynthesis integral membrane protein MurJ [bacterium]|tara:strand:- start:3678 stop:5351 length:1674 start_codon:yes stop_codon:yes gene_type:complete
MIERLFRTLHQEISGLHEAAYLLGVFALLSKILALLRDRLLAHNFGASEMLDIYYAAFRIPDFIYISLASLVASAVLIPFIVERLDKKEDAQRFFNNIFTIFFFAIVLVSVIVFIAMPALSNIVVPGLSPEAKTQLTLLSRIMLLSPILLGLSGLFASITQALRRFFVYALSPVLYNVGIIAGIIFLYPIWGLAGLAYGVVFGALLHVLIQIPVLLKQGFFPRFTLRIDMKEIKRVLTLSLPRTLTLSVHHLTLLVFVAIASFMEEGSISIFNFSFNLQSVPLSIIGVSYSVAAFPTLARLFSNGERDAFVSKVLSALRHIIFWSFPVMVLFIVLRAQIVRVVLGTGEFGWPETRLTAAALALFSVSVIAQSAILLLVRGYYAAGHTRAPLIINVTSSLLIVVLAFFFINLFNTNDFFVHFIESLFRISFVGGTAIIMLPLAFSLGTLLNVIVLWHFFRKQFNIAKTALGNTLRHSFYSSVFMGFVAHQFLKVFDDMFDINTFWGIFLQGFLSGLIGIVAGILLLRLLGNKEIKEAGRSLHHRFWKSKPIAPDQSEL